MKKPIFYWISITLALAALLVTGVAYDTIGQASRAKAKTISEAFAQHKPVSLSSEARALSAHARFLYKVGFALVMSGFLSMLFAIFRRENGWYLILIALLVCAIGAGMILPAT